MNLFQCTLDALYISDGVTLYKDRVKALVSLRSCVLNKLHPVRQGVTSMQNRAQQTVFGYYARHWRDSSQMSVLQSKFTFSTVNFIWTMRSSYKPFPNNNYRFFFPFFREYLFDCRLHVIRLVGNILNLQRNLSDCFAWIDKVHSKFLFQVIIEWWRTDIDT